MVIWGFQYNKIDKTYTQIRQYNDKCLVSGKLSAVESSEEERSLPAG